MRCFCFPQFKGKFWYGRVGNFYGITSKRSLKYIDRIYALQRYITRLARESGVGTSLVTELIYRAKINDERLDSLYLYPLALGMALMINYYDELKNSDIITYVPSHVSEYRIDVDGKRKDHAELLARVVSEKVNKPLIHALIKVRPQKMKELSKRERKEKVKGLYKLSENVRRFIQGKSIIVIDDICTTGYTLDECARILKQEGGASKVFGVVAGRAYL